VDLTTRLKLKKPAGSDDFKRIDINANWDILEAAPGLFICTSTTRPTWLAAQAGMTIIETDTKRIYEWDGAAWVRLFPQVSRFATGSGNTTLANGSMTPLPGLSITVNPTVDTKYFITASVSIATHAGASVDAYLFLDTTVQARSIHTYLSPATSSFFSTDSTVEMDGTYYQQWEITVPAGTHTLSLSAIANGNSLCIVTGDGSLRLVEC
jgi:hypothetical protein